VAATSFHNPAMLAKMAATVDEISGGRLILGLGAGWNEAEYTAYGFPFDRRASRFEEAFTIIRTLLRDGAIDFSGEFYEARDCELLPRGATDRHPNGPPLMIGSIGKRVLEYTAPHIDMWNAWHDWFGNTADGIAPLNAAVDEACRATGRDPREIARTVSVYVQLTGGTGRGASITRDPHPPHVGTRPDEMAATLRKYAATGISHVQFVLDPITVESIAECAPILEALDKG
jgi:alkanesulfonate monooxygenase SsuD/methylene tetrahydromethanopterin reductase-like flavin-dependent oxidoreductase (luciferase family)